MFPPSVTQHSGAIATDLSSSAGIWGTPRFWFESFVSEPTKDNRSIFRPIWWSNWFFFLFPQEIKTLNRWLEFGSRVTSTSSQRTVRTWDRSVPVWSVLSDPRGVSVSTGPSAQFCSAQTLEGFDLRRHQRRRKTEPAFLRRVGVTSQPGVSWGDRAPQSKDLLFSSTRWRMERRMPTSTWCKYPWKRRAVWNQKKLLVSALGEAGRYWDVSSFFMRGGGLGAANTHFLWADEHVGRHANSQTSALMRLPPHFAPQTCDWLDYKKSMKV